MAMSDRSKKSNLCYLLLYGGTKVCRALFEKRVNDLKPNNEDPKTWTVDKFLQLNRTTLELKLRREHKSKLTIVYPLAPRTTDINLWDVSLLCLILRESCGLSPTLRMYLEQLRKQRNKIAHLNDKEIDDIEYEYRFEKLKECIRKVLSETEDEALKITIQDMTTQLEAGLIPNDELLKVEQTICMSSEDIKQEVRNEHKETRKVIEKGDEKLTSKLEMMYSCQQEILRNLQELLKRFESKEEVETPPQEIMMELRTSHCSPQVERSASEEIVDMFNKEIGGNSKQLTCTSIDNDSELSASTKNTIELNHAVNDVCREFQERESAITKAEVGCIVLHIQCSSILSLLNLLQDYINGNLDKSMKKLEEAARSLKGCENLRLETIIYEDEFNRVLSVLNFNQFLRFPAVMEESSPDQNNSKEKLDDSRSDFNQFLRFPAVMEESSPDLNNSKEKLDDSRSESRRIWEEKLRQLELEEAQLQESRRMWEEKLRQLELEEAQLQDIVTSPLGSPVIERRGMGFTMYGDPSLSSQPQPQHVQQQILSLKQQQQLQQQMLLQQFQQQQQQLAQEHEKQLQDYHKQLVLLQKQQEYIVEQQKLEERQRIEKEIHEKTRLSQIKNKNKEEEKTMRKPELELKEAQHQARSEVDPQILERSKEMDIKDELNEEMQRTYEEMQRTYEEMQRKDEEMLRKRYEEMRRKRYGEMQRKHEEMQRKDEEMLRKRYKEMRRKHYEEIQRKEEEMQRKDEVMQRQHEEMKRMLYEELQRQREERVRQLELKVAQNQGMRIKGETKIPHCEMPASTEKAIVEHHELTTYKKTEQDK